MEKYYFIASDFAKAGVQMFLEAGLYEEFIEKEQYIKDFVFPPIDALHTPSWRRKIKKGDAAQMPQKLYLINKHRKIDFDLCYKNEGFIISDDFKRLIDSCEHPQYACSSLEIRTREGVCNARKEYWYIKILEPSECIDFSGSQVKIFPQRGAGEPLRIDKYLDSLYLDSNRFIQKELFFIDNAYIDNFLFCNQSTYEKILGSNLTTIKMFEIETLFDYLVEITKRWTKLIVE